MLLLKKSSETLPVRHLPNDIFWSLQFRKYIGYEGHLSFENVQNLMCISKLYTKMEKNSFLSEIIISELVALNDLY